MRGEFVFDLMCPLIIQLRKDFEFILLSAGHPIRAPD